MTCADWLALLESPALEDLRELDVTGGEPFLLDWLADLLLGVGHLSQDSLSRLQGLVITTNGFLTKKVLSTVGQVVRPLADYGLELVLVCGLDAVGRAHDDIRRYRGGWEKLNRTITELVSLRDRHENLVLGVKMTVAPHNIDEMERVADYAEQRSLFTIISPYILTPLRYGNLDRASDLEFSPEDIEKLCLFYRGDRFRWSYYAAELDRYLKEGTIRKPCSAGFNYYFVRSNGDVYPCPLISQPIGNVHQASFDAMIRSPEARQFRRGVGAFPECATCTEPGLERYALPFEGWHYLRLAGHMPRAQLRSLHAHLGLDKYF